MLVNAPALPVAKKVDAPAFAFNEMRGRSILAIALAIPVLLVALLLSGMWQIVAIGAILFVLGLLVDIYRFEVDPVRMKIEIHTLWLGWRERGVVTYAFSDVRRLERASLGDGISGYRWRFKDGATYEIWRINQRLYELFRVKEDAGVMKRDSTSDYSYGPQWRLVDRPDAVVLEPNFAGGALWTWIFCTATVAIFIFLAVRGSVPAIAAVGSAVACGAVAILVALYFASEARKGPWLRFDRVQRRLFLPRWALEFDAGALVAWETKGVFWDAGAETTPATELRLVVRTAGGEERYVLLACCTRRAVRVLAEKLAGATRLPHREADGHDAPGAPGGEAGDGEARDTGH